MRRLRGLSRTAEEFSEALTEVCADLATQLIGDAEGAEPRHRYPDLQRRQRTRRRRQPRVARSNLFKAAIFGKDPNWGRVLSAVGTTDAVFEPDQLNVAMNGVQICRNGAIGDDRNLVDLSPREVLVEIDLQGRRRRGHHLDQRPHARLRAREQRLLELSG